MFHQFILASATVSGLVFSALNVPLTVKDGANAGDIAQYPVKVSVPLPSGAYETVDRFRVTDNGGNTVPAQFDVLARWWPRNSGIRFMLVQFMADVAGAGRSRYFLKDDGTGNSAAGLAVTEDAGRYCINAARIRFEVRKTGFNVIDRLWYDADGNGAFEDAEEMIRPGDGNGAALYDTAGVRFRDTLKNDLRFTLEESGPLRMVLKVETPTEASDNGWGFIVRIEAYYNQPFVVLDYYLKNSAHGSTGHHLYFSKFALANSFSGLGNATVRTGGSLADNAGAFEGPLGDSSIVLQSTAWNAYTVNGTAQTGLSIGYADISDNEKGVMAVVHKFSYLWPTGLEVTPDKKLSVNLWPEGRHRMVDQTRRSHQVMLYFHAANATQAALFKQAKLFQKYPVPMLQPAWYARTRAFGDYGGVGFPSDTGWNEALYQPPASYTGTGDMLATGWWNWGGSPDKRNSSVTGGWVSHMDDYVPCGSPAYFYRADDVARHITEMRPMWMDDYDYPNDRTCLGIGYPPDVGLRPPKAGLDSTTWTSWDFEHIWIYEVGQYYFLSGERFCRDYLKMQADFTMLSNWDKSIADTMKWPYHDFSRSHGESMHAIVDAYKTTGEPRYWNMIMGFTEYLVNNAKSPYGIFMPSAFMSSLISAVASDIYFLLPDNTPVERVLKERLLLVLESANNGQVFWGTNTPTGNTQAWGQCYHFRADSVYQRPTSDQAYNEFYYVSYGANGLGLMYFMFGDTAYRHLIGRENPAGTLLKAPQNFMTANTAHGPARYYRISSAAWYCPDQKQAALPAGITDLRAVASEGNRVTLQWTSVGGDAYRIHWSDKPIVERFARIAPLDSGALWFPYPDTNPAFTNIYRAVPVDAPFGPKSAGAVETFTTTALPDSLAGKQIYFNVQAVNIASETDQSRGPISNIDSIELDGAHGGVEPIDSTPAVRIIREVHTMGGSEFFVILNAPIRMAVGSSMGISLSHAVKRTPLTVASVELDTNRGRLIRVRTAGLIEGEQYRLGLDSVQGAFYFLASFRANAFSTRKIHFGNNYHGNGYEVGHRWDGDCGFNLAAWNAIQWVDWDPEAVTDSSIRGYMALNYMPYGSEWFKITVSREIKDYSFSAYVNASAPRLLQVEDTMVWDSTKPPVDNVIRTDSLPLRIEDGRLDLIWQKLTYVHLSPVFKHLKAVAFNNIAVERTPSGEIAAAFLMNRPNPFNPATKILFSTGQVEKGAMVRLAVYNLRGQLVRDLAPAGVRPGRVYEVEWDGTDRNGVKTASGIYCARLTCGRKTLTLKLSLLK